MVLRDDPASLAAPLVLALALGSTVALPAHADELTIATLAPRSSLWGKVFRTWASQVKTKTKGALTLKFYWNGAQGGETTVVAKIRSGQIDGATLGAYGLSRIHTDVLALQLPGLFTTWQSIDRARAAVYPELKAAFEQKGFFLSSIGDVGRARTLSNGRAIRTPADLQRMKPAGPRHGVIAPVLASIVGFTPVPVDFAGLLPALTSGRVNVIVAPCLAAEQLQWAPYFTHVGADVSGIAVGAVVLSKKRIDAMPRDALAVMRDVGQKAGQALRKRVRLQDDLAFKRMARKMTVVTLTAAERRVWQQIFKKVRDKLKQGTFSPQLVRKLEAAATP